MKAKDWLFVLLVVVAVLVLVFLSGYRKGVDSVIVRERVDTLIVRDTVRIDKPVPVSRTVRDTVYLSDLDTLYLHDTLFVALAREEVTYRDSSYTAIVSGIEPSLDWIEVYGRTVYVEQEKVVREPRRWGIGVQAGYGVSYAGGFRLAPYIGIGLQYSILTF